MIRTKNSLALAALAALCSTSATFASTMPAHTFGTAVSSFQYTTNIDFNGLRLKNEINGGTSSPGAQHLSTDISVSTYIHGADLNIINTLKIAEQGAPVDVQAEVVMKEEGEITAGAGLDEIDHAVAALGAKGFTVMAAVYADGAPAKNALAAKGPTAKNAAWACTAGGNSVDMGLVASNKAGAHMVNLLAAGRSGFGSVVCYPDSALRHGHRQVLPARVGCTRESVHTGKATGSLWFRRPHSHIDTHFTYML